MCTIPNFAFGKVANRSVIQVFFPHMVGQYETRAIPVRDLEVIYDRCLRPLVCKHMQNMASHWPPSYSAAISLYCDKRGLIHEGSLDVPAHILDIFGQEYLQSLAALRPYFRDAYFVHEFRGWKASSVHDPGDALDRQLALDKFTDVLCMDKVDVQHWYIDVGLEFGHDNHVVTWRATSHETLLAHCLPSVDQDDIDSIVNRTTFHVDHMMHLKDLTGFRYAPGIKGRTDGVHYVQAYTTEKTTSYQLHEGLFTPLDPNSLLTTDNLKDLLGKVEEMSKIIFDCTADGDEFRKAQEGCACLEVRVAFSKALTALTTIPHNILHYCIVPLHAKSWWYVSTPQHLVMGKPDSMHELTQLTQVVQVVSSCCRAHGH
ncbi:hypothetical protein EDC04DRAFT_2588578 [Pisolithus marmoratus]|nr:hypothetical protein EDC04DRAFT_2588578 [Pisolithus marmoratus]